MAQPPLENGKKTRGRQRLELRRVEKKESRQVTFSKRKKGLLKKAAELAVVCHASVGVVIFSEAGKTFAFASPSADAVLGCGGGVQDWDALEALRRETEEKRAEVTREVKRVGDVGNKVVELQMQTGKRFWWQIDQAPLGKEELPVFTRALQRLRDNVRRRADKPQSTRRQTAVDSAAAVEPPLLLITGGLSPMLA